MHTLWMIVKVTEMLHYTMIQPIYVKKKDVGWSRKNLNIRYLTARKEIWFSSLQRSNLKHFLTILHVLYVQVTYFECENW